MFKIETGYILEDKDMEAFNEFRKGIIDGLDSDLEYYTNTFSMNPEESATIMVNMLIEYAALLACWTRKKYLGGEPSPEIWHSQTMRYFDNAVEDTKHIEPYFYPDDGGLKETVMDFEDTSNLREIVREHFGIDETLDEFIINLKNSWNKVCTPGTEIKE